MHFSKIAWKQNVLLHFMWNGGNRPAVNKRNPRLDFTLFWATMRQEKCWCNQVFIAYFYSLQHWWPSLTSASREKRWRILWREQDQSLKMLKRWQSQPVELDIPGERAEMFRRNNVRTYIVSELFFFLFLAIVGCVWLTFSKIVFLFVSKCFGQYDWLFRLY